MKKNIKKTVGFLFIMLFCTIIAVWMPQMGGAEGTEAFTGKSGTSGGLAWNITADGHLTVTGEGNYEPVVINSYIGRIMAPEWLKYHEYIHTAEINVTKITSTRYMFFNCRSLTSLDVSKFDTSNVTGMDYMFFGCSSLTSLDVSKFDTSNVTGMDYMFSGCSSLTSLDVSKFDTSNVTDMNLMFSGCSSLTSLDVSKFDTSNVTGMGFMFDDCNNLASLDVSGFDTSNVAHMHYMFSGCSSLTSLDVSKFDTSNVISMEYMFYDCSSLTSLDLSGFNTSNVGVMEYMFYGCSGLTSLDVSKFDTSNVTNMEYMFYGCSSLTSLDVSKFDTSNVTNMEYMFCGCRSLTSLDLGSFNTSNVTDMTLMFYGCSSLTSLDVSNFDTSKVAAERHFLLSDLSALEKLYFFANAPFEYYLPSSTDCRWINEDNETCTETARLDRKMTYTRVDKDYDPAVTPTPVPTSLPSPSPSAAPSPNPGVTPDAHIFSDYNYNNPVIDGDIVIYGNGMTRTVDGKKVNNRVATVYTDILASYKYTLNSKGIVKPSVGKVVAGITTSAAKPEVNSKNKITDIASDIAKAKIKNGQITINAVGKKGGIVYLWVIDTGSKGVSACCPVNVKLAPKKLEIQDTSGSKLAKNTGLKNGSTLDVCVAGSVGSTKTEDGTYTATVDSKYSSYVTVTPVAGSTDKFTITATGLENDKKTKVTVTFKCDQNNKKTKLSLVITE